MQEHASPDSANVQTTLLPIFDLCNSLLPLKTVCKLGVYWQKVYTVVGMHISQLSIDRLEDWLLSNQWKQLIKNSWDIDLLMLIASRDFFYGSWKLEKNMFSFIVDASSLWARYTLLKMTSFLVTAHQCEHKMSKGSFVVQIQSGKGAWALLCSQTITCPFKRT